MKLNSVQGYLKDLDYLNKLKENKNYIFIHESNDFVSIISSKEFESGDLEKLDNKLFEEKDLLIKPAVILSLDEDSNMMNLEAEVIWQMDNWYKDMFYRKEFKTKFSINKDMSSKDVKNTLLLAKDYVMSLAKELVYEKLGLNFDEKVDEDQLYLLSDWDEYVDLEGVIEYIYEK